MKIRPIIARILHRPLARAINDAGERIESLRFTVPALRVGVLEYAPGQLQSSDERLKGKTVKLYYPPEAVGAEKFLKSLQTAPVVVGGHDSTTNEQNKKIDGWAHTVSYDTTAKAAVISGIVKGSKEVAYIKGNLGQRDFGASAFVDIYDMEIKSGVTPDGQDYNAIAKDLRATHVALAPHVRDPGNKIKVTNAVVLNAAGIYDENSTSEEKGKTMEMTPEQVAGIVKNAVGEALAAKNAEDRIKELEAENEKLKAKNEAYEGKETEEEEKEEEKTKNSKAKNEDDTKKEEEKEGETVENAKPSQALVAAFATAFNVDFGTKTPSFATLAKLSGIAETDPVARISAVNTKFAELQAKADKPAGLKVEVF